MKKFLTVALTVLSAVFFALTLSACNNDETVNNVELKYELNKDRTGYIVMGLNDIKGKDVVIPDEYNGLPVVEIKSAAFMNMNSIKTVTVGNNVKKIGADAFRDIQNLESVSLGGGVEYIGDEAFGGCGKLTDVVLSDSLKFFGKNVFNNCGAIKYSVYNWAYYLGSADNPYLVLISTTDRGSEHFGAHDDCRFIADDAFSGSRALFKVEIGKNVVSIGDNAFNSCVNLKTVVIGDGVTDIGYAAFDNCYNLTDVTIGNGVERVGASTFGDQWEGNCAKLKLNEFDKALYLGNAENPYVLLYRMNSYDGLTFDKIENCAINENCKIIYGYAFSGCEKLAEINIPDSVVYVGDSAFSYCGSLKNVAIPEKVTEINFATFSQCTSLKSVKLGEGVKNIGGYAFADCTALSLVTIHRNLEYIDYHAFENCYKLVEVLNNSDLNIVVGEDIENGGIGKYALSVHSGESEMDVVGDTYKFLTVDGKNYLVDAVDKEEVYNLPENYKGKPYAIRDYAFYGMKCLSGVNIAGEITDIGDYAFSECKNLLTVSITAKLNDTGRYAFKNCPFLSKVVIGGSVKEIAPNSFENCNMLSSVKIFGGVESVGASAFLGCDNIKDINFVGDVNDWVKIKSLGELMRYGAASKKFFIDGTVLANVVISAADYVGDHAFYGCSSIVSVTLNESVKSIGNGAFANMRALTKVEIKGEAEIESGAFKNCANLTEVILSDKIKDIGSFAFMNSAVETITYGGTISEWNAIHKMYTWRDGAKIKTVKCTDGDIDLTAE